MTNSPLPTELWLNIADQNGLTRRDHRSLVCVSKSFFTIFSQVLYKSIRLIFPKRLDVFSVKKSKYACGDATLQGLLERLDKSEPLRSFVRTCRIEKLHCQGIGGIPGPRGRNAENAEALLGAVMTLIGSFPHLNAVYLSIMTVPTNWILYLARRPQLRLSITMFAVYTYGEPSGEDPFTARSLDITRGDHNNLLNSLMFGGSLHSLSLPMTSLSQLNTVHLAQGRPVLNNLQSLTLGQFTILSHKFLKFLPNLTHLGIKILTREGRAELESPPKEWEDVLPNLSSFSGDPELIPLLTKRRRIDSIHSLQNISNLSQLPTKSFGAKGPIRKLRVDNCTYTRQLIAYLIQSNPEIEEIDINGLYRRHGKTIIPPWIELFKQLSNLRILSFPIITYTTSLSQTMEMLGHEHAICEQLRKEGCPNITKVSFSGDITWYYYPEDNVWEYKTCL